MSRIIDLRDGGGNFWATGYNGGYREGTGSLTEELPTNLHESARNNHGRDARATEQPLLAGAGIPDNASPAPDFFDQVIGEVLATENAEDTEKKHGRDARATQPIYPSGGIDGRKIASPHLHQTGAAAVNRPGTFSFDKHPHGEAEPAGQSCPAGQAIGQDHGRDARATFARATFQLPTANCLLPTLCRMAAVILLAISLVGLAGCAAGAAVAKYNAAAGAAGEANASAAVLTESIDADAKKIQLAVGSGQLAVMAEKISWAAGKLRAWLAAYKQADAERQAAFDRQTARVAELEAADPMKKWLRITAIVLIVGGVIGTVVGYWRGLPIKTVSAVAFVCGMVVGGISYYAKTAMVVSLTVFGAGIVLVLAGMIAWVAYRVTRYGDSVREAIEELWEEDGSDGATGRRSDEGNTTGETPVPQGNTTAGPAVPQGKNTGETPVAQTGGAA